MGRGPDLLPVCSWACPPQRLPAGTSARAQPAQEKRRNTKPAGDSGPEGLPAGAAAGPDTRPRGGPELRPLPMGRSPLPAPGRVVLTRPRPASVGDRPLGCLRRRRGLRPGGPAFPSSEKDAHSALSPPVASFSTPRCPNPLLFLDFFLLVFS